MLYAADDGIIFFDFNQNLVPNVLDRLVNEFGIS